MTSLRTTSNFFVLSHISTVALITSNMINVLLTGGFVPFVFLIMLINPILKKNTLNSAHTCQIAGAFEITFPLFGFKLEQKVKVDQLVMWLKTFLSKLFIRECLGPAMLEIVPKQEGYHSGKSYFALYSLLS